MLKASPNSSSNHKVKKLNELINRAKCHAILDVQVRNGE